MRVTVHPLFSVSRMYQSDWNEVKTAHNDSWGQTCTKSVFLSCELEDSLCSSSKIGSDAKTCIICKNNE